MRLQFLNQQEKTDISNDIDSAKAGFRAALKAALHAQQQRRYSDAFLQAGVALECSRELAFQQRNPSALQRYCDTAWLISELLLTLGFEQLVEPFATAFNRDRRTLDASYGGKGLLGSTNNNLQKWLLDDAKPIPYRRRCYRRAGFAR